MKKRQLDAVIISDVHLGTYGCHAKELLQYLNSVAPKMLILNGDIIDGWQFSKSYFPKEHQAVISAIINFIAQGVPVHYITGNHDESLRKFSGFHLADFHLSDKLILDIDGKKAWIFHGDVFDLSVQHSKWIAKIGGKSYDYIILLNRWINSLLLAFGKEKVSLSKKIKNSIKKAVKYVSDFEKMAITHALDQNYDYVICGHIHQPQHKIIKDQSGKKIEYLNSGDWIENLSALELKDGQWEIYQYDETEYISLPQEVYENDTQTFRKIVVEKVLSEKICINDIVSLQKILN